MRGICVVTGAGGGIGSATAREACKAGYYVVLAGRTLDKVAAAARELTADGYAAAAIQCDITDESSVEALAREAKSLGSITAVIHTAGISPGMGKAVDILQTNALGTYYVHRAFADKIEPGGCLIDTASLAAHLLPAVMRPCRIYGKILKDPAVFQRKMLRLLRFVPSKIQSGIAYAFSKDFVIWYMRKETKRFAERGVRILSVSPGNFDTPMGNLEKEHGGEYFMKYCALRRFGKPEEIASLYIALLNESLGYLTGTDILCDGGLMAGRRG